MFVKKNLELQRKIYATTIIRNMIKIFNGKILFILSEIKCSVQDIFLDIAPL